jgi:putative DNA primase/helicase
MTKWALDALQSIPADIGRDEWVRVGMSAHAAELTFEDFDQWSSTGQTYDQKACQHTWKSFRADGGVGPGTLFHIASQYGWRHPDAAMRSDCHTKKAEAVPTVSVMDCWNRFNSATVQHLYVQDKLAQGCPLRQLRVVPENDPLRIMGVSMSGALAVPCFRLDGSISNLQFITVGDSAAKLVAQGKSKKLNLPGGKVEGWYTVGEVVAGRVIYIAEGLGTAWACWIATGDAAVVAFGWGNVKKVAAALRQQYPSTHLVLVPDVGKEVNADRIASEFRCAVAKMPNTENNNFDANDLLQREGSDVLAQILESAVAPELPPALLKPINVKDVISYPSDAPAFAWEGYLPMGVASMLGAHGGTGKSTIALMLAVSVASGRPLFGIPVKQGNALFVSLEDSPQIVRHRLAHICKLWAIDPKTLDGTLQIVDGTEYPELFSAETRGPGKTTDTYSELCRLVNNQKISILVVDNASDAYGGDEIQRRQVRAFIRALTELAKLSGCAVLLLAHVDKNTSRTSNAQGGEGYSGSTAWHNSVRSRLFMTRQKDGSLLIEHQKSNLGKLQKPLTLYWPDGRLPTLAEDDSYGYSVQDRMNGRLEDEKATVILRMIAEFAHRQHFCSPSSTARTNVFSTLKNEPAFKRLNLTAGDCRRIVDQCQRAKWIDIENYRHDRKDRQRWVLTKEGEIFCGLTFEPAPSAHSAPTVTSSEEGAQSAGGAHSAPSSVGGVGDRAHAPAGESPLQ